MFCLLDRIISYLLRLECNFIQYRILSSIVLIIIWGLKHKTIAQNKMNINVFYLQFKEKGLRAFFCSCA